MAWVLKNSAIGVAIIGSTPQTTSFNLTSGDVLGVAKPAILSGVPTDPAFMEGTTA